MEIGVSIALDERALQAALNRLSALVTFDGAELMEAISRKGEAQTLHRITDEKTAPDGTPWKPNLAGTPILRQSGVNLEGSVASSSDAEEAVWGAGWEFAHIHQDGAVITANTAAALSFRIGGRTVHAKSVTIPARPFVGLSAENRAELEELISDHFGRILGAEGAGGAP